MEQRNENLPANIPQPEKQGATTVAQASLLKCAIVSAVISLGCSISTAYVYHTYYAQRIVTFDIRGFLEELKQQWITGQINEIQMGDRIEALSTKLKQMQHNSVILSSEIVLNNSAPVIKIKSDQEQK